MNRAIPSSWRPGRTSLIVIAPILVLCLGFGIGYRAASARVQEPRPSARSHAVSENVWVSSEQIRDRFPTARHEEFMRRAIANSRMAGVEKRTGGVFGAVIVDRDGHVISDGSNHVVSDFDPTWHGEMEAIRVACARLKALKLDGCILYTSAEPCPMCLATAYWAGIDGVVFGAFATDSKKYGGFDDSFIYEEFARPADQRKLPLVQLMRDQAVTVWKEYAAMPGNVPY
jgi:guanine deaminase